MLPHLIQKSIRLDSFKNYVDLYEEPISNTIRVLGLDDFNNIVDENVDFIFVKESNRIYLKLPENWSDDEQFQILYATMNTMNNEKKKINEGNNKTVQPYCTSTTSTVATNPEQFCCVSSTSPVITDPITNVSFTCFSDFDSIKDIDIIVPGKVLQVTFGNGDKEKMVLKYPDEFDIEKCLYIALTKKMYKKDLTPEGIEYFSDRLKYCKKYKKIVDKGIKLYYSKINQMEKDAQEAKELSKQIERKRKKKEEYKNRRKEKRIQEESDKEMAILNNVLKDIVVELKEVSEKVKDKNVDSLNDIFGNFKKGNSDTDNKDNNDSNDYLKELEELLNKLKEEFCN